MTKNQERPYSMVDNIAYTRYGTKKEAVVFIHGFLEDLRMWDGFIERVPGYSVIKVDLPGFGQSQAVDSISIAGYADAIKKVIEKEGIQKVILIGHSMGGYTALAFAKKYANLLKGLCLFHSQPYPDNKASKAKREKSIEFVETHGEAAYVKATMPNLFAPPFVKTNRSVVDAMIQKGEENDSTGIIAAIKAMKNRKSTAKVLEDIQVPVHFIIGTEDAAIPAENSMNQIPLPAISKVDVYKGVGHMGMFEKKHKTQQAIRDFIRFCS